MEATIFSKTPWPRWYNEKYLVVNETQKQAVEAWDGQQTYAVSCVGAPSECWLPSSWLFKMDLQTWEAVSYEFCLILLYQTYDIDLAPINKHLKLMISTIGGWLPDWAVHSFVHSYQLDLDCEPELWIQIMELPFDDSYLSWTWMTRNYC